MPDQSQILLQTKLHRPPITRGLVERPHLLEQLNTGIHCPLTLVVASAGFGKTTLVSTWLEHITAGRKESAASLPAAWLSLDVEDSDLNVFLRYFVAALRTIFANACEETLILLQAVQQPPLEVLFATLSNEMEQLSEDFIFVLDDFHNIRGEEVNGLLNVLARHWPKPLHMVLISRVSPPLPLSNLRAKGMISEIRTRDLRFTLEETTAFLNQAQVAHLSQDALPLLDERFEGWPAGLHLAALSLRSAGSQEAILSGLYEDNTNITGYLVDEVLSQQVPAIQTFLLKTSILDRYCASLCKAILGEIDTAWNVDACIDWIEHSEMFITPLDNRREWYRYHRLFQELLQERASAEMTPEEVNHLHCLASAWFEEHGLLEEALHHALEAGDLDMAARQMSTGVNEVINRGDRPTLERWLRLIPEEMIQRRPDLLMIRAWAMQFMWQPTQQIKVLQQVEELLIADGGASLTADNLKILRGQVILLRAQQAYFSNQPLLAIDQCKEILALMPPAWAYVRGGAMLFLGLSMQASGQVLEAERLLLDDYRECKDKTNVYPLMLLNSLGYVYLNTGQLEQARQTARMLSQQAALSRLPIRRSWGDFFLGMVHYQRNELEAAKQAFTQIVDNRYTAQITNFREAIAGLALIHQINGESAKACQMIDSVSQFDLEQSGSEDNRTCSLRARLMLLQGDLEGAGRWVDAFTDPLPDQPLMWLEEPQVTRARILLAIGKEADLQLALQIIDTLEDITERTHNIRCKIEILALRALALEAQRETAEAEAALKQAVDLARPGGFIRVFVDLGPPMQVMLRRLAKQGHSMETIRRILAAFPQDDNNLVDSKRNAQPSRHPSLGLSMLAEPLTPRELEVLILLQGPSSIKEIANQLHISYATARRHTINLYGKLGVNQRWNAVARAEELSLLPPR
jgi:LuxR family maltose regulon positive regulatory protein